MAKDIDYKRAMHNDLTDAFIQYQWNLDNPFPTFKEPPKYSSSIDVNSPLGKYQTDSLFRRKVDSLVAGVMNIVIKHVD